MSNGICDANHCRQESEIYLAQHKAELCDPHWFDYVDRKPVTLRRGRVINIPVNSKGEI